MFMRVIIPQSKGPGNECCCRSERIRENIVPVNYEEANRKWMMKGFERKVINSKQNIKSSTDILWI